MKLVSFPIHFNGKIFPITVIIQSEKTTTITITTVFYIHCCVNNCYKPNFSVQCPLNFSNGRKYLYMARIELQTQC